MTEFDDLPEEVADEVYFLVKADRGGKNQYSLDRKVLRLEDVLPNQLTYPESYGIVIKTHCDDGKPLDGFVLLQESPAPGTLVKARPVGVLRIKKGGRRDEKIVCVALEDKDYNQVEDLEEVSKDRLEKIADFFETYGYLSGEEVTVEGWFGRDRAEKLLEHSRKLYKRKGK